MVALKQVRDWYRKSIYYYCYYYVVKGVKNDHWLETVLTAKRNSVISNHQSKGWKWRQSENFIADGALSTSF